MMMGTNYSNHGPQGMPIYGVSEEVISSSLEQSSSHPTSFLYNLSVLKDRVHQVQSLASIFLSPDHGQPPESTAIAIPTMGTLIQEIIVTASSMMFACQQMAIGSPSTNNNESQQNRPNKTAQSGSPLAQPGEDRFYYTSHHDPLDQTWYGENYNSNNNNNQSTTCVEVSTTSNEDCLKELPPKIEINDVGLSPNSYDIVELDASDILAKYTHYCHVCGKGFKRDANLRMHMRAHGDEYKSSAALSNPMKNRNNNDTSGENVKLARKYSCPQQGCRWNKNHAKFQPLKSMICVKNHYKRSHCPKMYVCKRCNTKQFSVLSDLKTHEKHCGDLKWQCSCGTTFSRKDKLMGHVTLFVGHAPVNVSLSKGIGAQISNMQLQLDGV